MSDLGRKGFGQQAQEKITPDSQKSTFDKASENVTSGLDKAASSFQPQDSKSTSQKLGDSTRSGADDAQNQGKSFIDQASDAASGAAKSVQDTFSGKK